jgi:hypothetical protein
MQSPLRTAKCARVVQCEPPRGGQVRHAQIFQVRELLLSRAVSFKTELAVLHARGALPVGVDGWTGNGILPLLHVRAVRPRRETSEEGGAPADLRPELTAFSPCRHAARSREPGTVRSCSDFFSPTGLDRMRHSTAIKPRDSLRIELPC